MISVLIKTLFYYLVNLKCAKLMLSITLMIVLTAQITVNVITDKWLCSLQLVGLLLMVIEPSVLS
jgi:hypothetical protein